MRVFICGPHADEAGLPNDAAFLAAEAQLRALGYDTGNPVRLQGGGAASPQAALVLLTECDGLALLPGWHADMDAQLFKKAATRCGLNVQELPAWPSYGPPLAPWSPQPLAHQRTGLANTGRRGVGA